MFENTFSRRKGYTPPPVQGKLEEISAYTRNRLWDIFYISIYRANQIDDLQGGLDLLPPLRFLFRKIWTELYHRRIDEYTGPETSLWMLKRGFFGEDVWYFLFNILEATFEFPATHNSCLSPARRS